MANGDWCFVWLAPTRRTCLWLQNWQSGDPITSYLVPLGQIQGGRGLPGDALDVPGGAISAEGHLDGPCISGIRAILEVDRCARPGDVQRLAGDLAQCLYRVALSWYPGNMLAPGRWCWCLCQ